MIDSDKFTTISVGEMKMPDGSRKNVISSAGMKGRVPKRLIEDGEEVIKNKIPGQNKGTGSSANDAEQTIFREADKLGASVEAIGATRKMCPGCQDAAIKRNELGNVVTPLEER